MGVYVVPTATTVSTLLPTEVGRTYQLTVTGLASYGDRAGVMDCGYWTDPDGGNLLLLWHATPHLYVNGVAQDCGAFNAEHTYAIRKAGDGTVWTLRFCECNGFDLDNAGALVVAVQGT